MSRKDKTLPTPPKAGNRFREEERGAGPLMADQMAMAAAAGKIDQFMEKALPDSEHARKLATMMMGMTGMMPPPRPEAPPTAAQGQTEPAAEEPAAGIAETPPPDEVLQAVQNADVKGLMDLLRHEHSKRSGAGIPDLAAGCCPQPPAPQQLHPQPLPGASVEKKLIDSVLAISAENELTPDWVVTRALKLYVEGYEKTGRL